MADKAPKVAEEEYNEEPAVLDQKAEALALAIKRSKHFIVFTGAGMSNAAGIPDFRGPEGAWTLRVQGRQRTGETVSTLQAIPTPAHMALVSCRDAGYSSISSVGIVTACIEGARFQRMISELHGNSNRESCKDCGKEYIRDFRAVATYEKTIRDHRTGRKCARCGGVLHDSIVNFGESLPAEALELAFKHAKKADLCLVLGSSLMVTPANEIPEIPGRRKGAKLAICNLQKTPLNGLADIHTTVHPRRRLAVHLQAGKLKVAGVDEDGTPDTYLRSGRLEGTRRVLRSEPFLFNFREAVDTDLSLELEFMGHCAEPNLVLNSGSGDVESLYLLELDPSRGQWQVTRL